MRTPDTVDVANTDDVRESYRLLLGRTPEDAELEAFVRKLRQQPMSAKDVARLLMQSDEFARLEGLEPVEVMLDGYSMLVRENDRDIGQVVMRKRTWEPTVTAAVREYLHEGNVFLDVGANIGYYVAMAAHIVGAEGKVFAFEPLDKNLQLIYATIESNAFAQVKVHPFAASDAAGVVLIETGPRTSNGQIVKGRSRNRKTLFVQTVRIDDVVESAQKVDVAKFDVEGHELKAWRGATRLLERSRPLVFTEFHPQCLRQNAETDPLEYAAVLFGYGKVVALHFNGGRSPCEDAEHLMRVWANEDSALQANGTAHLDLLVAPSY